MDEEKFTSMYTEHGIKTETEARNAFVFVAGKSVIQTGLIVCQSNPKFAHSPDGIVFDNGFPRELVEIKCPFKGKSMSVKEAILYELKGCLVIENGKYCLKKKHKYYGQVQLGMSVINVKVCSFVIYAPFDKSIMIIPVDFDEHFIVEMLSKLKVLFFDTMLHEKCKRKNANDENDANVINM